MHRDDNCYTRRNLSYIGYLSLILLLVSSIVVRCCRGESFVSFLHFLPARRCKNLSYKYCVTVFACVMPCMMSSSRSCLPVICFPLSPPFLIVKKRKPNHHMIHLLQQVSSLYRKCSGGLFVPMTLRSLLRTVREADLKGRAGLTPEDVKKVQLDQSTYRVTVFRPQPEAPIKNTNES